MLTVLIFGDKLIVLPNRDIDIMCQNTFDGKMIISQVFNYIFCLRVSKSTSKFGVSFIGFSKHIVVTDKDTIINTLINIIYSMIHLPKALKS